VSCIEAFCAQNCANLCTLTDGTCQVIHMQAPLFRGADVQLGLEDELLGLGGGDPICECNALVITSSKKFPSICLRAADWPLKSKCLP